MLKKIYGLLFTHSTPWDFLFSKGISYNLLIELKDGKTIGGSFHGENSYASEFPFKQQLFLERTYSLDENSNFVVDELGYIDRFSILPYGILVDMSEIKLIKFYSIDAEFKNVKN